MHDSTPAQTPDAPVRTGWESAPQNVTMQHIAPAQTPVGAR